VIGLGLGLEIGLELELQQQHELGLGLGCCEPVTSEETSELLRPLMSLMPLALVSAAAEIY